MHFCKIDIFKKIKSSKLRLLHKSRPRLNVYLTNFVPMGMWLHFEPEPWSLEKSETMPTLTQMMLQGSAS